MTEGISIEPYLEDLAQKALREKKVDKPCPRCGNNSFFFLEVGTTHMLTLFCKKCGFKFEHLLSILIEPTRDSTPDHAEAE